jgi:hypothetical protein
MLRASVILAALVFNAPIIYQALGPQTINVDEAIMRFIITLPVAGILIGLIRMATTHHDDGADELAHGERTDVDGRPSD